MNLISQTRRIELLLKNHHLLTLEEAQPKMAIECKQGVIWVTSSGDNRDYMLNAGQSFMPQNKTQVVIEAMDDSLVNIIER